LSDSDRIICKKQFQKEEEENKRIKNNFPPEDKNENEEGQKE
jgi:hypothetical protein